MTTKPSSPRIRIAVVAIALLLGFSLLVVQLFRWTVFARDEYRPESHLPADLAHTAGRPRGDERGVIVDQHGVPLAIDRFRWEVWVEPNLVPRGTEVELGSQLVQLLGPSLLVSPEELMTALRERKPGVLYLAREAPHEAGSTVDSWHYLYAAAKAVPVRYYPQGTLAAHLLGFVNGQPRAYYGVEEYYDDYLRKVDPPFLRSDDQAQAVYNGLPAEWSQMLPSSTGQDLVLTIDRRVQYATERVLAQAVEEYKAESGTIIVMRPDDGAILAMASVPTYDANQFGSTNADLLLNPAIAKQYEPGSVFKIVTFASGLDAGVVTPETIMTDTLSIEIGDRQIFNSNQRTFGEVTVEEALVRSLNIPTAEIALKLQESRFYQYVHRFGFGQLTEVDLANESPGTVKVPGDELWSRSDLGTNSFGQGLAVTPLQMATATCVIANGGLLVRPHVVDTMVFKGKVVKPDTLPVRRVISAKAAQEVNDMMVQVVEQGSFGARVPGYTVAGKTGTAQVAIAGGYSLTETIHSFVGFMPAENPVFVALVKLDVPKTYPWAEGTAAPTFAKLANELLRIWHLPPAQVAQKP
ncbi:MAG: penicillin-binding protein 2 [Anaerolineae bacterium]|nr:penicillin-binding protein 2 [Anaerolineae bacterium]